MKTEDEWKKELTPEAYHVLREKGTERPFSGQYYYNQASGEYHCAACGNLLFHSATKFDAGCGWPSFYKTVSEQAITTESDSSLGMLRTEVKCGRCGSHLGHVFDDGPQPTGKRFCMNSIALHFENKQ